MARSLLKRLIPIIIFILIWQGTAIVVHVYRHVAFPNPWETTLTLFHLLAGTPLADHPIYLHIRDSLGRWLLGFGIASISGIAYGLVAGWSRSFKDATYLILHILQLIPGLAWIPVAILCFGIGETATIFMIAITAFTPIALNVLSGVEQLDTTFVRAARMLGANGRALLFHVLLPGALPNILSGLRIGLGNGWRVLVAAEMIVGTGTGLGYSIIQARWTLDYRAAFACLMVICLIGLLVEHLIFNPLEKATVSKWNLNGDV
jgi:ABC-type nitrate/sulfonate/bicarbonate transport system permease component